jgi:hypothetical protein
MNFKQFYNESVSPFDVFIRYMTEDELINVGITHEDQIFSKQLDYNKGWCVLFDVNKEEDFVIYWLAGPRNDNSLGLRFYKPFHGAKYLNVAGDVYKGTKTAKIIEDFEFRQSLHPDTLNTFGELIDEL